MLFGSFDDTPGIYTSAPVVDFAIVCLMIAVAAQKVGITHQVSYSYAFLQGIRTNEVYMTVRRFLEVVPVEKVLLLRKSLHGLREPPRIWCDQLSAELIYIGLKPLPSPPCVFAREG